MKKVLWNLSSEELIDFVAAEIESYRQDRANGMPYGSVKLSEIKEYERNMQRAKFTEHGAAVYNDLLSILEEDGRITKPKASKVLSPYEVQSRQNHLFLGNR